MIPGCAAALGKIITNRASSNKMKKKKMLSDLFKIEMRVVRGIMIDPKVLRDDVYIFFNMGVMTDTQNK